MLCVQSADEFHRAGRRKLDVEYFDFVVWVSILERRLRLGERHAKPNPYQVKIALRA